VADTATFRYYSETVLVKTPFSQKVVDAIKGTFHYSHREWDPEKKTWKLWFGTDREAVEKVIAVCLAEEWLVRKIFPDGERYTIYPTGEVVGEKQEDLFG
jgi:hypothetical protein